MDMGINMKMSKKFLAGALIFSACSALSTVAQADNTITFNGIVSDTTCTATIDGGVTAIDMGTTSVADLKAYTFGAAKNFSFSLADCPTAEEGGNSIARVTFGGVSDTANSDYFKNQAIDEPATGVAVALFDEAGNVMKNNEEGSDVDISSGAATIPFTVKMVKSGDADPTKGTVQTTVTYNVTYH
ncbi:TPA: fimbrial protein [Klebsiella pneumoniae]|uniref:fimbrial protein n=1 Tax=Klebsiella pneumoniae TaxID=573 RepID=UPI0015F2F6D3|nr:fimbrial protein [Klebsiella pneumoniae]MCP6272622.1 fimbrial protein [Klebsiella pneumoniae]MDZ0105860.1 fimbrial protein [Klebsiella pneumoniae]UDD12229.1 fimbrial protein [Klebsiella pneumoniae]HBQ8658346.1 fimbrial protein [Klebsiella pneumoniae]HBR1248612.1 fimbrial protein [Klebsiella pneumoniae]